MRELKNRADRGIDSHDHMISIIVPVYNVEKYLHDFFDSILSQTFEDFKLFIVNDCSVDSSLAIAQSYQEENPDKVEVLSTAQNSGVAAARNYALDNCNISGKYVMFLDSDDYVEPVFLERLFSAAEESGVNVTICGFDRIDGETGAVLGQDMCSNPDKEINNIYESDIIAYNRFCLWNKLYKRDLVINSRFPDELYEDIFWFLRILPEIKSVAFINEALYHHRIRRQSLGTFVSTESFYGIIEDYRKFSEEYQSCIEYYHAYVPLLELVVFVRCGIGATCRTARNDFRLMRRYSKISCTALDECYPGWRKNKFLSFAICKKRGRMGMVIWLASILHKIKLFPLFLLAYSLYIKLRKYEPGW